MPEVLPFFNRKGTILMSISSLTQKIPGYGRDIRLNVESVLSPEGAPGLTEAQLVTIALSSAYAVQHADVIAAVEGHFAEQITPELKEASKGAATIMAMNNIYYRFLHLADDKEFGKLPARLRMSIIGKPGIPKADFELACLAISAISGCGMCINAHVHEVRKAEISNEAIQSAVRIASVLNAAKQAIVIV